MSGFLYPTGIASGYSGMAAYFASRIGSVTGATGMTAPPAPTGNDGFLQAMADVVLSLGYLGSADQFAIGAATTTSTSFGDVGDGASTGFASWSADASVFPVSRIYRVHVTVSGFVTTNTGRISYQLVVDGAAVGSQPTASSSHYFSTTSDRNRLSWVVPAFLSAGSHVLKLQWKVNAGTVTGNVNTDDVLQMVVT